MYTPRALLSRLFPQIVRFTRSLYIVGQLVIIPGEIIACEGKVWSVYVHTVKWIMRCRDIWLSVFFFKKAASRDLGFDPTENGAYQSAVLENPI